MNAVERLLAHGERLLSLFDEMYRPPNPDDWGTATFFDPSVERLPPTSFYSEPWVSLYWWQAAVQIAVDEVGFDFSAERASAILRDRLAQRESLLDRSTWQQMVAEVVRDCREWDFLAKKVVRLAQEIADSAIFIEEEVRPDSHGGDWQMVRYSLHRHLGFLRRIAQPPADTGSSPKQQHSSSGPRATGGREGVGGNPGVWSREMKRQILSDHDQHLKTCKRQRQRPLKQTTWVTQWATEGGRKMSRKDALRLWEAAKRQRCRDRKKRR